MLPLEDVAGRAAFHSVDSKCERVTLLENVQFRCPRRSEKAFNVHLPFQSLFEFLSSDVMRISNSDAALDLAPAAPPVDYSALLKEKNPKKANSYVIFFLFFCVLQWSTNIHTIYRKEEK
jgi:hypothetical protein